MSSLIESFVCLASHSVLTTFNCSKQGSQGITPIGKISYTRVRLFVGAVALCLQNGGFNETWFVLWNITVIINNPADSDNKNNPADCFRIFLKIMHFCIRAFGKVERMPFVLKWQNTVFWKKLSFFNITI